MASPSNSIENVKRCKSSDSENTIMTRSKTRSLSAGSRSSNGSANFSYWTLLPAEILVRVYQLLDDNDRAAMALVCKHWGSFFKEASLWRERHFIFAGMRAMQSTRKSCAFITNVGPYLHKLVLECGHPVLHTAKPIAEAITVFLSHVCKARKMKIKTFKVVYLDCYHSWRFFDVSRAKLVTALCKFLRKQKELRNLELCGAHMLSAEGMRMVESVAKSPSRKTLTSLHIKDLFEPRYPAYQDSRFRDHLSQFINLKKLVLNYIYVSEEVLAILGSTAQNKLEYLRLVVDSTEPCNHIISPYEWRDFSDKCPNARVVFNFLGKLSLADYKCVFARCVPVSDIDILSWDRYPSDRNPQEDNMPGVLSHIAMTYMHQLVTFRLACDYATDPPIDTALLNFFHKCNALKDVCINTAIKVSTVEQICNVLRNKKPRVIENLELKIRDLSQEEITALRNIAVLNGNQLGLRNIEVHPDMDE